MRVWSKATAAIIGPMAALAAGKAAAEIDAGAYVTVRQGRVPIIISAPHGGETLIPGIATREDVGQRFFTIVRDQRTAELAEMLASRLEHALGGPPFVVIARFDRRHVDANRAPEDAYTPPGDGGPKLVYDAYHKALADAAAEVTRRWGAGLLLDIHGQSRFPDVVVRGTRNGATVASLIARAGAEAVTGPTSVFGALAAKGYRTAPTGAPDDRDERFFSGGHIIDAHGSGNGGKVDAIQVEVGSRFRAPERLATTARDLAAAVAVFAKAHLPRPEPKAGSAR